MKVNREEFLQALNKIKAGLSNKGIVEEAACFIFDGKYITSFNDRISIAYPFESDFNCSVSGDELIKTVQNSKAEQLVLKCSDQEFILRDKKFRAGITIINNSLKEVMPINNLESLKWKKCPEDLIKGIEQCLFSTAKNSSVAYLNCIAVKQDQVVSSDNFRISQFVLSQPIKETFLIPLSSAIELVSVKDISHYCQHESWLYLKTQSGLLFFCRLIDLEFPDVSGLLQTADKSVVISFPTKQLQEAIQGCSVFSDSIDVDKKIEIVVEEGQLLCRGKNNKGWIEYKIEHADAPDIRFEIHPDFLYSVLPMITEAIIDENKLHIHADNFKHLVALC